MSEGIERVRVVEPDADRRGDNGLQSSSHSRILDSLRAPTGSTDPDRASDLCAMVTRQLLGELAPGLALLGAAKRRRVQALAAYTRTLFDFALDSGMHGERLARINRWEFSLDQALDGDPPTQPVFVAMALAHAQSPWDSDALDAIAASARSVAVHSQFEPAVQALVTALLAALTDQHPPPALTEIACRVVNLHWRRSGAGADDNLSAHRPGDFSPPDNATEALDPAWRRCLLYIADATERICSAPSGKIPVLGIGNRIVLLLKAWLGG